MSENQGIFISERPTMYPAACSRCGANVYDGRKYVDFGVDQELPPVAESGMVEGSERKGVVYLCSFCVREIFKATFPDMGLPVAQIESDLADAKQTIELQKSVIFKLREEVDFHKKSTHSPVAYAHEEGLEDRVDATRDRYAKLASNSSDSSDSSSGDEAESDVPEPTPTESGTSEPDSKPRHSDVPSLAELLKTRG